MIYLYMHNKEIRCSSLGNINNRMISFSNIKRNEMFIYGTVATYSCSPGFSLSSTQSRVCVGDGNGTVGRFNGSEPSCEGRSKERHLQTNNFNGSL